MAGKAIAGTPGDRCPFLPPLPHTHSHSQAEARDIIGVLAASYSMYLKAACDAAVSLPSSHSGRKAATVWGTEAKYVWRIYIHIPRYVWRVDHIMAR